MINELEIVAIPSGGEEWLVFPSAIVARILPYASLLSANQASEFVVGGFLLQNEKIPVLDFVFTPRQEAYTGTLHLALIATVTEKANFPYFAMISHGRPVMSSLFEEQIKKRDGKPHHLIADYVTITDYTSRKDAILDLPALESGLHIG